MNIELYINKRLCDLDKSRLKILLKRKFFDASELNFKDAQKSYEITLPATPNNNEIFSYKNAEETTDKFQIYDNAEVYVSGVRVFKGKFRMSEIGKSYYKGNLGVPAPQTAKDVFGDLNMSQAGTWILPFEGIKDLEVYNNEGYNSQGIKKYDLGEISPAIFPIVLYSLLPKVPLSENQYSDKLLYDDTVRLGLDDLPPSVNVIQMLKKIFENANYTLSGTALDDERLKKLYVSYKNPSDYVMPWGYGSAFAQGSFKIVRDGVLEKNLKAYNYIGKKVLSYNVFNAKNNVTTVRNDPSNIFNRKDGRITLRAPVSAYYKLTFGVTYSMPDQTILFEDSFNVQSQTLNDLKTEIKVLRNFSGVLDEIKYDNFFYDENSGQEEGGQNLIFPKQGEVNFIDPLQNKDFLCGFSFGNPNFGLMTNPLDPDYCNPMAASGGQSWSVNAVDAEKVTSDRSYSATKSTGYVYQDGTPANKFIVDLDAFTLVLKNNDRVVSGQINQIVWLEANDTLDIVATTAYYINVTDYTVGNHEFTYSIALEPYQKDFGWLKMGSNGSSLMPISWFANSSFKFGELDLIKFLPTNVKINDWIDNFCKAFNLRLENKRGNEFELNIKDVGINKLSTRLIDLDNKASVNLCTNEPLGLPKSYELGFSIDQDEEGYIQSMMVDGSTGEKILNTGVTGGGTFDTGSYETTKIQQTSSFSYTWYKGIEHKDIILPFPVITEGDIWKEDGDYSELMKSTYFDKAQRFWYKIGTQQFTLSKYFDADLKADMALVGNEYNGNNKLILDYEDKPNSIMKSYFTLLTNRRNYTIVECYLTPEEYESLPYSLIRFNSDLYNVAEVDGYDPTGNSKCSLKLIKRIK